MREIMRTMSYPNKARFLAGVAYGFSKFAILLATLYTLRAARWLFTPVR